MRVINGVLRGWSWCKGFIAGIVAFLLLVFGVVLFSDQFKIKYKDRKGNKATLSD